MLILVLTIAGGLGLLAGGGRPREVLHFVYAVVVLGLLPVVDMLVRRVGPGGRAVATLAGAAIGLGVVVRLFQTG